jgi:methionine aminotransferase
MTNSSLPPQIVSKLPNVGTTIFSVMSKLAIENDAINLSQGFPDFDTSKELHDLVRHFINEGFNQYAPMPGIPVLLEQISAKIEKLYDKKYNPANEITVTAGATQAIFTAIGAVVDKGDEVIIIEPAYDCYAPTVELFGGKPVYVKTTPPIFNIDWKEVEQAVTHKTKLIIVNTPNNPSGYVFTADDITQLRNIVVKNNLLVLSDEVYEHIIFDDRKHLSIANDEVLSKRAFIVFSFGKTFHVTGWKIGYCLAPEFLMNEFRKVHQFNVFTVNTPIQLAIAEYLKAEKHFTELPHFYQHKRDYFNQLIASSKFELLPCNGTYFQCATYDKISSLPDYDFAKELTIKHKVAVIPNSSFFHDKSVTNTIRFSFSKKEETLKQAATLLCQI